MKKKTIKKVYKKQIKRKARKRTVKKQSTFFNIFNIFNNIKRWFTGGMKKIRKEQRHCLRFKKNKGKQTFCFVKALFLKYTWRTMAGLIVVIIIGLFIVTVDFQNSSIENYIGINLETSLIDQLISKISSLTAQISDRQKCIQDQYWKSSTGNICKDWMYQQNNKHCAKFGVKTTRVAIGTKICCEPLDTIVYSGKKKNVTACPASTIFFDSRKMFEATIVPDESKCQLGICQFYPSAGNIIKFDVHGNIAYGEQGQPKIIKPCKVERNVGACDKDCGGGKRNVTGVDMYCNHFSMQELCNVEPCFTETTVN